MYAGLSLCVEAWVCMGVCVGGVCVGVWVCMCMYVCGGQKLTLDLILDLSLPYTLKQSMSQDSK